MNYTLPAKPVLPHIQITGTRLNKSAVLVYGSVFIFWALVVLNAVGAL